MELGAMGMVTMVEEVLATAAAGLLEVKEAVMVGLVVEAREREVVEKASEETEPAAGAKEGLEKGAAEDESAVHAEEVEAMEQAAADQERAEATEAVMAVVMRVGLVGWTVTVAMAVV